MTKYVSELNSTLKDTAYAAVAMERAVENAKRVSELNKEIRASAERANASLAGTINVLRQDRDTVSRLTELNYRTAMILDEANGQLKRSLARYPRQTEVIDDSVYSDADVIRFIDRLTQN